MIKPKLLVTALAVSLLFAKANAQDTTHYDLGRIQLKKEFTQSITVKGEDIEKMPFTNLADAINVWFYGTYSNSVTLVYVIDGNLVNDVNAYSIYDIDEITLVQNAVTNISGGVGPQQLVLIKTKRAKLKGFGITASGQANISSLYTNSTFNAQTNAYETGLKSTTTLYQQYYVSAYENKDNIKLGISADYLRDVLPVITEQGVTYKTPENFNRLKLNGYLDVKMGTSMLDITASYDPEKGADVLNAASAGVQSAQYGYANNHIFNGTLSLITHIAPGFTNSIHGDYNYARENSYGNEINTFSNTINTSNYKAEDYNHNIVAYDNLSYDVKLGGWGLEPAVNINFRIYKDSTYYGSFGYDANGNSEGYSYSYGATKKHLFLLTPSVNLYYKRYFNIQGGFLDDLATIGGYNINNAVPAKVLPFVTASMDLMKLIDTNSSVTLKLYGSYAINDLFTDNFNSLTGLSNPGTQVPVLGSINNGATTTYTGTNIYTSSAALLSQGTVKKFTTISAGLTISPQKTNLSLSYYFEKSNYLSPVFVYAPYGTNSSQLLSTYANTNSILNRLSLSYYLNRGAFKWQTGINATMLQQDYPGYDYNNIKQSMGNGEWTGGWVNRLTYRDFFAGIDALYQFGQKVYSESTTGAFTPNKINSFSLQNLYAGYRLKIKGLKDPEIFASGRNIFQNKKEDITDDRKYYGLGLNFAL